MTTTTDPVVATLNDLIATCKDSQLEYETAANDVESMDLKEIFNTCCDQRARFVRELEQRVVQRGGEPMVRGSISGVLLRNWITLKSALMGFCEHSVLVECDRCERLAMRHYELALGRGLPTEVQEVVERQYDEILHTQKDVHALAAGSN